jgi:hypothetical protein
MAIPFEVGDKIRVTDPGIINELRAEHSILRRLRHSGEKQTFVIGEGGRTVPAEPRQDSDYLFDSIEGFVVIACEAMHPVGNAEWDRDKFVSLDVVLVAGEVATLKDCWVERVEDAELPECRYCRSGTRNWSFKPYGDWSCIKCEEAGITTWVSKECLRCRCPEWDHGGSGGCFGSPEKPCDGCAGFMSDKEEDDVVCSQKRYDEIQARREAWAEHCRKQRNA